MLVLGSGPIRIGQGIEFDYSCVHCVWALEALGYRAIVINNNPETVSTDFDTGDGLYFEPVTLEDVLNVIRHEEPIGVVCQFGGQTAINLAAPLSDAGVAVLGTSPEAIAKAEDRAQFDQLMEDLGIARPKGKAVTSLSEAVRVAGDVGYPVLVRPSFVLGGRAMEIVYSEEELRLFYREAEAANPGQPVLVDKYMLGLEAEIDVVSDGVDTLVPGIMEHIERAGIHSGDSMAVYPPVSIPGEIQAEMVESACRIARALNVRGLMNIQFVIASDSTGRPTPFVIEVNPRASRTVPFLSKVTGIKMVDLATKCMMGGSLSEAGYGSGLWIPRPGTSKGVPGGFVANPDEIVEAVTASPPLYAVKAPVFSFQKLRLVEPSLGPEMKSTGEIMGVDFTFEAALFKALVASGIQFKGDGYVLLTVRDSDKAEAAAIAKELCGKGFRIAATQGTHYALETAAVDSRLLLKIGEGSPNLLDFILDGNVSLMINSPSSDSVAEKEAALIRRACLETGVACITSIDTARALARAIGHFSNPQGVSCLRLEEYFAGSAQ